MIKLNQFNVVVTIASVPQLKQTQNGLQILEFVGQTPDGKQSIQFTAFKDTATDLHPKLVLGSTWAIFGSVGGKTYQDRNGGTRCAVSLFVNAAIQVEAAPHMATPDQPTFTDEDIPF